jgi:TPR repeat protein
MHELAISAPFSTFHTTQGYAGSRVKVGDYNYYGRGVAVNYVAAAHEYHTASEARNAQVSYEP